jgi:hypothetical protein
MSTRSENQKGFSAVRYWRYIFTPLLLVTLLFGLFMLFTAPDAQTAPFKTLLQRTDVSLGSSASAPSASLLGMNILQSIQRLQADPSAP